MDFILCGAGGKGGDGPNYTSTIAGGGSGGHFVKQTNVACHYLCFCLLKQNFLVYLRPVHCFFQNPGCF
jgi:hypothetical protein